MVKHSHYHTCESTLFYNQSAKMIASHCQFSFYHNKTVPPSVLDGGKDLILANVHLKHSPTCDPKCLPHIPSGDYIHTSCDILCNCTLQSNSAHLPSDIGTCPDVLTPLSFQEKPNMAFVTLFRDNH